MRFGNFEVDEKAFQLREHGQPVRLERIPMELMILLVRNRSRLVTRDEILGQIWGINHYLESESAVNTAIRKLRRALRDDAAHPRMIETVPGKGYRFIAPAQHESAGVKPPPPDPEAVRCFLRGRHAWNKKTVDAYENALVHFQQAIDHDAAYAPSLVGVAHCYVMMGIHGLKPANEVYPLARAAAHSALEINADSAEAITALGDVAKGYDHNWKQAEHYFRRAIELNPEYAVAHQWYANLLSIVGRHEEAVTEAEEARRLDPLSVGPAGFVGFTLYRARQFDDALRECEKTAELHKQAPIAAWFLAHVLIQRGRVEEADRALTRTMQLASQSGMHLALLSFAKARAGKHSQAREILQKMELAQTQRYISPFDLSIAHFGLGAHETAVGLMSKAIAERVMRVTELPMPFFDDVRRYPDIAEFCATLSCS
jgi:DNA-binding winged helix-turn-helix (wHTH) protein/tetratricopeptide (TPR) repeat protein